MVRFLAEQPTEEELVKKYLDPDFVFKALIDPFFFASELVTIDDLVTGMPIPFNAKLAQYELDRIIDEKGLVYVLKARRLGMTKWVSLRNLHKCISREGSRILVIAQDDESAKAILADHYRAMYESLPQCWRNIPEIQLVDPNNKHEMSFANGSYILSISAGTETGRGRAFHTLHLTEFAQYQNIPKIMASAVNTAHHNADIVLETTARGLNEAHALWYDKYSAYHKLFFSWGVDVQCTRDAPPKVTIEDENGQTHEEEFIPEELLKLKDELKLTDEQINWGAYTYMSKHPGDWATFCQEYPLTPEMAFITSGKRVFNYMSFPHAEALPGEQWHAVPVRTPDGRYEHGPEKYRVYVMGVDTASGSPDGDFSAIKLIDATNKKKVTEVWSYYGRLPTDQFSEIVLRMARRFKALVVVESNSYGNDVLLHLRHNDYGLLYRRTVPSKMGDTYVESLGFNTNVNTRPILLGRLNEFFRLKKYAIEDERLKAEINSFVYDSNGKPIAETGRHDDMIFATGLALQGLDQVDSVEETVKAERPTSISEMLLYEVAQGELYKKARHKRFGGNRFPRCSPLVGLSSKGRKKRW